MRAVREVPAAAFRREPTHQQETADSMQLYAPACTSARFGVVRALACSFASTLDLLAPGGE
eukprot:5418131-Alexandrium_andersonii.AAC.1